MNSITDLNVLLIEKFTNFETEIEFYQQSSGTSTRIFDHYVSDESVKGIVVGAYGAGNVQGRLVPYIQRAVKMGKPVLVVTSCRLGAADMGIYEVGSAPLKAGAISAGDMGIECAMQKMMYAVGKTSNISGDKILIIKEIIHKPVLDDIGITENRF